LNGPLAYSNTFDVEGNLTACSLYYYAALQPQVNGYAIPLVVKLVGQMSASEIVFLSALPDVIPFGRPDVQTKPARYDKTLFGFQNGPEHRRDHLLRHEYQRFSSKDYGIYTGLGAVTGTVDSVMGAGVSAAASALMSGTQLPASIAASVVSGVVAGAATDTVSEMVNQAISNAIGDAAGLTYHSLTYGLGDAAWERALEGGVGRGIGGGAAAKSSRLEDPTGPEDPDRAAVEKRLKPATAQRARPTFDDLRGIIPRYPQVG